MTRHRAQPTPASTPAGVLPWWLAAERRLTEVEAAVARYRAAEEQPLPEWETEAALLRAALAGRGVAVADEIEVHPLNLRPYDVIVEAHTPRRFTVRRPRGDTP